jgi:hypothetical protein
MLFSLSLFLLAIDSIGAAVVRSLAAASDTAHTNTSLPMLLGQGWGRLYPAVQ